MVEETLNYRRRLYNNRNLMGRILDNFNKVELLNIRKFSDVLAEQAPLHFDKIQHTCSNEDAKEEPV